MVHSSRGGGVMKAVTYTEYGPPEVLAISEVEKPAPADDEVLIEVNAASVDYADWAFLRGTPFVVRLMGSGLLRPKTWNLFVRSARTTL
jgi:NADPH:quinone reductase-like Zn-dependent oxidoreductase